MKRWIALFLVIACMMSLAGCADFLFVTKTYRTCHSFAERHRPGMDKQAVLKALGCPEAYWDGEGVLHTRQNGNWDQFENDVLSDDAVKWVYEFYKYSDPAGPHRLFVVFDADGKSVSAELVVVYGG